jgi:hypothetical protein
VLDAEDGGVWFDLLQLMRWIAMFDPILNMCLISPAHALCELTLIIVSHVANANANVAEPPPPPSQVDCITSMCPALHLTPGMCCDAKQEDV